MKAYPVEIRQKIVDTYAEGNISQRELAKRFKVAKSFVQKLLKQHRETGSVEPKIRTQQTPPKLNVQQLEALREIIREHHDATLDELRYYLKLRTTVSVSVSTMFRTLSKMRITRKKNADSNPER